MNSKFKGLLNLKKKNFILNIDNNINCLKLKKQNSSYFTSTEFFAVSEPYRASTKLLSQNSRKLFDRNLRWIYCLIELNSLYQNRILCLISVDYFLRILIRKFDSSTVRIRFGDKFGTGKFYKFGGSTVKTLQFLLIRISLSIFLSLNYQCPSKNPNSNAFLLLEMGTDEKLARYSRLIWLLLRVYLVELSLV